MLYVDNITNCNIKFCPEYINLSGFACCYDTDKKDLSKNSGKFIDIQGGNRAFEKYENEPFWVFS